MSDVVALISHRCAQSWDSTVVLCLEEIMKIKELKRDGHSMRSISRQTGHSRNTVKKVVEGELLTHHFVTLTISSIPSFLVTPAVTQETHKIWCAF